jgi:hypothetical protein
MKAKDFDCVEMKHAIQQRILEEFGGLSPEEQRRRTQELIQRDPLLARIWQHARRTVTARSNPQGS